MQVRTSLSFNSIIHSTGFPLAALTTVTTARAPAWLINACSTLEVLADSLTTNENGGSNTPRIMSAMSAVLVTVGAIPALPGVAAGAGGAFLASGVVQAAGAVGMGVGHALKVIADGQTAAAKEREAAAVAVVDGKK